MLEPQSCLGPAFANSTYQFLLSGTSTPANVYQDGALTNPFPITGYVTSDNFGRFPPIYLDTSIIYRVQFFNSANVQQWQVDPYTPPLATTGTSTNVSYGIGIDVTGEFIFAAPAAGGTGITLTLNAGALGTEALAVIGTLAGNSAIAVNNSATTGAHTATFTASNKPGTATSAPAGWLPITCDGVQYYTPIWHGNPFTPYVVNPSALGEVINASSVTFTGTGLTTVVGGTAVPVNWFSPTSTGIGAGYYINITKTGGLSGLAFSAAQGAWTNIGAGGLTITSNASSEILGTYQISTSVTGSPVVATGVINLSGNAGVQSFDINGVTPFVLAGNGTSTLGGAGFANWFTPTTSNVGSSYWIKIIQTGGTSGYSFSAASGAWTNITNGGITIGISGTGQTSFNVSGAYYIASDSAGAHILGDGLITLSGTSGAGSSVQSPNWSGTTPLNLAGNGSATLNGASTSSWFSPNVANSGSGYYINVTRTSGTAGVNFSAAQGSWTNITNSGLSIDMTGYTGDVGTVSVGGTWQISSSVSGLPVLGSGTISLSVNAGTVTRTYTTGTAATETAPTGATTVVIEEWGGPAGGGGGVATAFAPPANTGGGGGGPGYSRSSYTTSGGKTVIYTVGAKGLGGAIGTNGTAGTASSVSSGTLAVTTMTANGGALGVGASAGSGNSGPGGAGGTAAGGNQANTSGSAGTAGTPGSPGSGGSAPAGVNGSGSSGGGGGSVNTAGSNGVGTGKIVFKYS
jgi:hypothetical protein